MKKDRQSGTGIKKCEGCCFYGDTDVRRRLIH